MNRKNAAHGELCPRVSFGKSAGIAGLLFGLVVGACSLAEDATAQSRLSGLVYASSGCEIVPPGAVEVCAPAIIPIAGRISFRSVGEKTRHIAKIGRNGNFTRILGKGTYRVRMLEGRVGSRTLRRDEYRISPEFITIGPSDPPAHHSVYFVVNHRSQPDAPGARVSSGCGVE